VRLGTRTPSDFLQSLNSENDLIQKKFLEKIKTLINPVTIKVMLGDATVTEQTTFDPKDVQTYYENFLKKLDGWTIQDVSISNNEDLRRIFTKFEIKEGNYLISGHLSVQYHVLLFYKPDQKVIEYQKTLGDIIEQSEKREKQNSDINDQFVLEKLIEKGYKDLDHQKLFEIFFKNEQLSKEIQKEIEEKSDTSFKDLENRRLEMIKNLDNLLVETYQTSPVLIDDAKLVTGEEGCLCTIDIEFVKNRIREGLFDPKKISDNIKNKIQLRIKEILECL
jgi:hypothetical protein